MILLHLFILPSIYWLKSSLESKTSPKHLCEGVDCVLLLLKAKGWWETLLRLCEKRTSIACFAGSGLNIIFHWYAQVQFQIMSYLLPWRKGMYSQWLTRIYYLQLTVEKIPLLAVFTNKYLWPCRCSGTFFTALTNCEISKAKIKREIMKIQIIEIQI